MQTFVKKTLFIVGIFFVFAFAADRYLFFRQGLLERIAAPIVYPFVWTAGSIGNFIQDITERKERYAVMAKKYEQLKVDHQILLDEVIKQRAVHASYQSIKPLLEFEQRYNLASAQLAKIVVKHIADNQHYFIINRGERDGVRKDMIALSHNHLIGRVSEVYHNFSKVTLITDASCKVAAFASSTRAGGIVQGTNTINRCRLSYVSHLSSVADNDLILSSGQGLVFPEGFCLGKIVSHALIEKELYHQIELEPMINLERLRTCLLTSYDLIQTATRLAPEVLACPQLQPGLALNATQPAVAAMPAAAMPAIVATPITNTCTPTPPSLNLNENICVPN